MMSIGFIFSAIGATCLAAASFAKTKKHMLTWQLSDYFFTMIANFLLGGYTGAISISVSIIRNTLMIKNWDSIYSTILLVIIQISAGTYFNNLGLIGLLPLISSVSYTIVSFATDKVQWLRWVTVENMILWAFYDFTIKAYPALIMDVFITITTLIAIAKYSSFGKKKKEHE